MKDLIERQAAIDAMTEYGNGRAVYISVEEAARRIEQLPSAQPERTCVNCGRTANNGGWYADGRTRCPIEEHYALPKDGYCHLWEKRNVTDDDYPERREAEVGTDCISRQATIEEIIAQEAIYSDDAVEILKRLPSVQPEIIRCRDCRKYRSLGCPMGITVFDAPDPDGYCYKAERRTDERSN